MRKTWQREAGALVPAPTEVSIPNIAVSPCPVFNYGSERLAYNARYSITEDPWCPLTESNCRLMLTRQLLYHLTKGAVF